jgi:hypothetical protein
MSPVEILTLVPLGALVVAFGVQPGLLLDLVEGTVADTVTSGTAGTPIAIPTEIVVLLLTLLIVGVVARTVYALLASRSTTTAVVPAEGGAAH